MQRGETSTDTKPQTYQLMPSTSDSSTADSVIDCGLGRRSEAGYDPALFTALATDSRIIAFLGKGDRFDRDTVVVSNETALQGVPMDSAMHTAFGRYYRLDTTLITEQLFLIGRVQLDSSWTGYLIRSPGMYDPSVIDLWFHNVAEGRMRAPVCLAESWGDAGEIVQFSSVLTDLDGDGRRDLVQRFFYSYDEPGLMDDDTAADTTEAEMRERLSAWRNMGGTFGERRSIDAPRLRQLLTRGR